MNPRPLLPVFVLFLLVALVGLAAWLLLRSPRPKAEYRDGGATTSKPPAVAQSPAASPPVPGAVPAVTPLSAKDQTTAASALRQFFSHFPSMGGGEAGPPFAYVAREIADRDKGKVLRAFDELLYRYSPRDSLPVLRSYLNDADAYTRFKAAESLLIAGDDSGVAALTALLKADQPIEGVSKNEDLRVSAAEVLAQYHQTAALPEMLDIYTKTKNVQLTKALASLGISLPNQNDFSFVPSSLALVEYAQTKTTRFLPQITTLYEHTNNSELKAAAAWSLATLTGDQAATTYLIEKARSGLDQANAEDARYERQYIKYIGTLQTPEAKQTLERALNSPDGVVVQTAIVNLLYNQGGSDLAIQKVADRLTDSVHNPLSVDFVFNVAAKFSDHPVLGAAGEHYAHANGGNNAALWRQNVENRRTWPSANWVGDYMIQVKR